MIYYIKLRDTRLVSVYPTMFIAYPVFIAIGVGHFCLNHHYCCLSSVNSCIHYSHFLGHLCPSSLKHAGIIVTCESETWLYQLESCRYVKNPPCFFTTHYYDLDLLDWKQVNFLFNLLPVYAFCQLDCS